MAPLGYLALRSIGLAMGQNRPPTQKESRVVGSIFVGLTIFIISIFKVIEPELKAKTSEAWDWSLLMWFVWSIYFEVGLRAVTTTGMLSAVAMGLRWTGLMDKN